MDLLTQQQIIANRQKLLDAMRQQYMAPVPNQTAGGFVIPNSTAVIGNLLSQHFANQGIQSNQQAASQLENQIQQGTQDSVKRVIAEINNGNLNQAAMETSTDPYLAQNKNAQNVILSLIRQKSASQGNAYYKTEPYTYTDNQGNDKAGIMSFDARSQTMKPVYVDKSGNPTFENTGIHAEPPKYSASILGGIAGRQQGAKNNAQMWTQWTQDGIAAADGMAQANRALTLLKSVKTSGFDNIKRIAKQWLGIDSADEAQLAADMGRTILKNLRPTFGAQFTEREGRRLETISASFTNSTQNNIRLLNEELQLFQRAAERGIQGARLSGNPEAENQIRKSMTMEITPNASPTNIPKTSSSNDGWGNVTVSQ